MSDETILTKTDKSVSIESDVKQSNNTITIDEEKPASSFSNNEHVIINEDYKEVDSCKKDSNPQKNEGNVNEKKFQEKEIQESDQVKSDVLVDSESNLESISGENIDENEKNIDFKLENVEKDLAEIFGENFESMETSDIEKDVENETTKEESTTLILSDTSELKENPSELIIQVGTNAEISDAQKITKSIELDDILEKKETTNTIEEECEIPSKLKSLTIEKPKSFTSTIDTEITNKTSESGKEDIEKENSTKPDDNSENVVNPTDLVDLLNNEKNISKPEEKTTNIEIQKETKIAENADEIKKEANTEEISTIELKTIEIDEETVKTNDQDEKSTTKEKENNDKSPMLVIDESMDIDESLQVIEIDDEDELSTQNTSTAAETPTPKVRMNTIDKNATDNDMQVDDISATLNDEKPTTTINVSNVTNADNNKLSSSTSLNDAASTNNVTETISANIATDDKTTPTDIIAETIPPATDAKKTEDVIEIYDEDEAMNANKTSTTDIISKIEEVINHTILSVSDEIASIKISNTPKSTNDVDYIDAGLDPIEDVTDQVFYEKDCINYECQKDHKQFFYAPAFALNYFKVNKKKSKLQYVCITCHDKALTFIEECCEDLKAKRPLLLNNYAHQLRSDYVEIIDSSSDEEDTTKRMRKRGSFTKNSLQLIEDELNNTITEVMDKIDLRDQLTWSKTVLETRFKNLHKETNDTDNVLRFLQRKTDQMYQTLYSNQKLVSRSLDPIDINTGQLYEPGRDTLNKSVLPPSGEIQRAPITVGDMYFAVKNASIGSWVPCKVIEKVENRDHYKIRFIKTVYQTRVLPAKHLAYFEAPSVRLPIGERVIAYFDASLLSRGKEKVQVQSAFYPGIIAEPMKPNNKFRYLIFYDDGYTQYVSHKDVRLVCQVSENVWDDVHIGSRDFIQTYLKQYSVNRPMVQTQRGQSMSTETNGNWRFARVIEVDCSLVLMQFDTTRYHTEWIYRGSMRLGPVFKEYEKSLQKDTPATALSSRLSRRTEPYIRYTDEMDASNNQLHQSQQRRQQHQTTAIEATTLSNSAEARAVAKKRLARSTAQSQVPPSNQSAAPTVRHLNYSTIYLEDDVTPRGKVVYYTAKRNLPAKEYKQHNCSPICLFKITHNLNSYSPLSKPLLSGWERLFIRNRNKKSVVYRSPCGLMLRNMKELHKYLRITKNNLNVDNFDYNPDTNCLAEFVIDNAIVQVTDISNGLEKMPLPLVNHYDNSLPPTLKYAAQRIPTVGVNLNLDEEFLCGCDCEDDCSDKAKCACWRLTYAGAKYGCPNTPISEIGYQYRRLHEHVPTGVYECNSRCKCKSYCLNRVVQNSLQTKLQVFKTTNRGWGLRCMNDIPKGCFICIYAGYLLTEASANEGGIDAGDEYFAELDYIEVAEQIKEGYESDAYSPVGGYYEDDDDEEYKLPENDDDDEFKPSKSVLKTTRGNTQRSTRSNQEDDDASDRIAINFNPSSDMKESHLQQKHKSVRQMFGKDESCYIMDAKVTGNLGRYFNHSCSPNLFVQNVFVDTHDLRFPWVAFFSSSHIRAGTELTWNYNYEVGVVPGKVLYCQCGAPNCRGRLL